VREQRRRSWVYRTRLQRVFACSIIAVVVRLLAFASPVLAHGGPPLRLGTTRDPALSAVARLALVHLREGVGFAVDWREFPDEAALRAAFAAGGIDIAVGLAGADRLPPSPIADCPPEALALLREGLSRLWRAEAFVLGFPVGPSPCSRPALIVSRAVLKDLRFGILGKESARLASFLTREDVDAVQTAAGRHGERAATAAAREALAVKGKR
jgi:hypothetical protein